jgi:hypothetical protein
MKNIRTIEHADGTGTMQIIRAISLLKALESRGIDPFGKSTVSGQDMEDLLDRAISAGIHIPYKQYEKLSKVESRIFMAEIDEKASGFKLEKNSTRSEPGSFDIHGKTSDEILEAVKLSRQKK